MFVLARIQIVREIPLKVKSVYDHLNTQKFHTFVYEQKAFAVQSNFSELFRARNCDRYGRICDLIFLICD